MFTKFRMFRKTVRPVGAEVSAQDTTLSHPLTSHAEPPEDSPQPTARKLPSAETLDRIRGEIEQAQSFFSDRAQFGIGMACNAMEDPVVLRGFVDFNQYDVDSENPSFWKLQTQSGLMFGQLNADGAFVYPAKVDKNAPFENSKLGRGLAGFGAQFQPEVAKSKPMLKPVGSVTLQKLDEAFDFCKTHKAPVAITLLARHLPDGAHCVFASVRRLRTLENGIKRVSLGVYLRNPLGVIKFYRLLLDGEKAVLVENDNKIIASIKSDMIASSAADCQRP